MDIRHLELDEYPRAVRLFLRTMGIDQPSPERLDRYQVEFAPERSIGAFDDDDIVGTTFSHLFEYTLPGGVLIPAAGVTAVAVAATHRRQGIMSSLMRRQLTEARDRGEPLAILIASESVIYGRFGYGPSSQLLDVEIDLRDAAFRDPARRPGRVRSVDDDAADRIFPDVYDRWRRMQPGAIDRPGYWWETGRLERKPHTKTYVVHEDEDGNVDGYVRYTLKMRWEQGLPAYVLTVEDLAATTADAYAALWRHCLDVDLVRTVRADTRPVDEPLRWLLANPRALRVTRMGDHYWTRILDVGTALASRTYRAPVDIVLGVTDPMFEENSGSYALAVEADGSASCERTDAPPDLTLQVAELGAILSGGVPPSELAGVGRLREETPGALAKADAAFSSAPKPYSRTWF